jgi:hypothetical protein
LCRFGLALERIGELRAEARREFLVRDAVAVRQNTLRHVERAEYEVDNREGGGEILLAAAFGGGVMPAMEAGEAITYLNGPSVQSSLAWTKAECAMMIGSRTTKMLGEMPMSSITTSASTAPKNRLIGWKSAAEIHYRSSEE